RPRVARSASFAYDFHGDLAAVAAARHDDDAVGEGDAEVEVDGARIVEETVEIGVVERFGAKDVHAGLDRGDRELALRPQREGADRRPARDAERDDMGAEDRLIVFRHPAGDAA